MTPAASTSATRARLTRHAARHVRENSSVLAALERRLLLWIAARVPVAVGPDHLTAVGLLATVGVGVAFARSARHPELLYLVPVLLTVNWLGDSLDGTVARVRNQQRPRYGYYVDHVVDLVGACAVFGGLALSGGMQPALALLLLVAYLAVMAESFLATHVNGVFRLAAFGFGPTELRLVLAVGAVALVGRPMVQVPLVGPTPLFDLGGLIGIVGLAIAFCTSASRTARRLAEEERLEP